MISRQKSEGFREHLRVSGNQLNKRIHKRSGLEPPAPLCRALTVNVAILGGGGDPLALDLDVFPAGAAVELVDPDLPAAQLVRHCALRPHILLKIRRRVILPLFMQKGKIKYVTGLLSNPG